MQDVDLRDLEAFLAVARTGNFRRAAREHRVSVSSLSQRLRDMEERLGVRLVNRTTRSVALTEAGADFVAMIGPALKTVEEGVERLRSSRGQVAGVLRLNAPRLALPLAPKKPDAVLLRLASRPLPKNASRSEEHTSELQSP